MLACRLHAIGSDLRLERLERPRAAAGEIIVEVATCGVCRTDLHLIDGELPPVPLPVTPGHEVVGRVIERGAGVSEFALGDRVGLPWLAHTCGECRFCRAGLENLCVAARFTGYHGDGGYAEYARADARFALPIPSGYSDIEAAPLLCAGLIGYRAYRAAGAARRIGLYGFGAAAHLLAQWARVQGREIFAFTRAGDRDAQQHARSLGAAWAGESGEAPPQKLDAAILFAPAGELIPEALRHLEPGGRVICGGIYMSRIPEFNYALLWGERSIQSIANLTRADGRDFMQLAGQVRLKVAAQTYPLAAANEALQALRAGQVRGAAVLTLR